MMDLFHDILRAVDRRSIDDWALVFGIVVSLGFFCLRGFGSRSTY